MTATDAIRWAWTILTGVGVLFAAGNLREAVLDHRALRTLAERPGLDLLRLQTRGAAVSMGLLMLLHACNFGAGVCALAGLGTGALIGLVASAAVAIVLAYTQLQHQRRITEALRLDRIQHRASHHGGYRSGD